MFLLIMVFDFITTIGIRVRLESVYCENKHHLRLLTRKNTIIKNELQFISK